ncbi:MAG: RNA 2',3'-cyclic phosphodiesterase [Mogibacterium sp.]|nr:RNA 2',3'-cyclic phosphodiesterase [Mogibacterium sp.]
MRLFIAINLNDEMKDALMDLQDTMRTYGVRGRETPAENMHLTLAFIGDYDDHDYVKSIVDSIEVRPFDIKLSGIGAFGDLWWAGIEDSAPIQAVVRRLRRALAEADIPFDRKKFSPHITLIRRANGRLSDASKEEMAEHFGITMRVDHISLMRSDRGKHGMIYTEL